MSTIRANTILDAAGGNTVTVNGITPALATQAEAEAGTDNAKLMTPLRVKQAVDAQVVIPPAESVTLLGTLTTSSGTVQTLSGLTLTGYKFLQLSIDTVLTVGTGSSLLFGTDIVTGRYISLSNPSSTWHGGVFVDLSTGMFFASIATSTSGPVNQGYAGLSAITNASTSVTLYSYGRNFGGGAIRIYGMK
jgi:hypothetical protein